MHCRPFHQYQIRDPAGWDGLYAIHHGNRCRIKRDFFLYFEKKELTEVTYATSHKNMMFTCDSLDTSDTLRVLSDDERLLVSGAANPWAAVIGGLQGSVAGGIAGAVTGPMLGVPWAASGLAGMASGAIQGAFGGWFSPR
ncbi:hypothetical protein [Burkholderia sp. PU8-34]